ncbi:MAG TPA: hypothetical protein VGX49_01770 [Jatrophihabitans sp.]|jgi:hypothetical protein|nr:hypothetical protein [Jatrophihabitans sp.]
MSIVVAGYPERFVAEMTASPLSGSALDRAENCLTGLAATRQNDSCAHR